MAASFNMSLLDFKQDKRVLIFLNIMFGHSKMSVMNKALLRTLQQL